MPTVPIDPPPLRRNALVRLMLRLHLLPRPESPPEALEAPEELAAADDLSLCECGHPRHPYDTPHPKPFLPRDSPEPEFEEWEEEENNEDEELRVRNPAPPYVATVRPPRLVLYRQPEFTGPTPAPWTMAAESWAACEREHDHFLIKVRIGEHKRVYCLPWHGEQTTFGHIKAKFAHDVYKHLGLGPLFLELWVHGHTVPDTDVPAFHGVKHRDTLECSIVPQLLRKPLPEYKDVTPLPLASYEVLYGPQLPVNSTETPSSPTGNDLRVGATRSDEQPASADSRERSLSDWLYIIARIDADLAPPPASRMPHPGRMGSRSVTYIALPPGHEGLSLQDLSDILANANHRVPTGSSFELSSFNNSRPSTSAHAHDRTCPCSGELTEERLLSLPSRRRAAQRPGSANWSTAGEPRTSIGLERSSA